MTPNICTPQIVRERGSAAAQETLDGGKLAAGLGVMADEKTLDPTLAEWAREVRLADNAALRTTSEGAFTEDGSRYGRSSISEDTPGSIYASGRGTLLFQVSRCIFHMSSSCFHSTMIFPRSTNLSWLRTENSPTSKAYSPIGITS